MHRALDQLKVRPEAIIVDGNRFKPYKDLPYTTIVKGDGKYMSIAAASILAKLTEMITWMLWLKNIRSMTGKAIRDILLKSIVQPLRNMV